MDNLKRLPSANTGFCGGDASRYLDVAEVTAKELGFSDDRERQAMIKKLDLLYSDLSSFGKDMIKRGIMNAVIHERTI